MKRLKRVLSVIFVLFWVLLGLWLVQDNPDTITLRLAGFGIGDLPAGIWVIGFFSFGVVIGLFASGLTVLRLKRAVRRDAELEAAASRRNIQPKQPSRHTP